MESLNLMEEELEISSRETVKVRMVDLDLVTNGAFFGIQSAKTAITRLHVASVHLNAHKTCQT